jgi:hypothetical protein
MMWLDGFGLWWKHSDMIGSVTEVVCDMLVDALVSVGMKGSMIMMMVVASVLCG